MLKKIMEDLQISFNILKFYIIQLERENKKLKAQIKIFNNDIYEIIESNKK